MRPAGFEPATHSLEGCCSIQLSYGRSMFGKPSAGAGSPIDAADLVRSLSPRGGLAFLAET
jgi:hypothetical protein